MGHVTGHGLAIGQYDSYASLQFKFDFGGQSATGTLSNASIMLTDADVIWAVYPADGTADINTAFSLTTGERSSDAPTSSIPIGQIRIFPLSNVVIKYTPDSSGGSSVFYLNAYVWAKGKTLGSGNVNFLPTIDANLILSDGASGTTYADQNASNIAVTWKKVTSSSSAP